MRKCARRPQRPGPQQGLGEQVSSSFPNTETGPSGTGAEWEEARGRVTDRPQDSVNSLGCRHPSGPREHGATSSPTSIHRAPAPREGCTLPLHGGCRYRSLWPQPPPIGAQEQIGGCPKGRELGAPVVPETAKVPGSHWAARVSRLFPSTAAPTGKAKVPRPTCPSPLSPTCFSPHSQGSQTASLPFSPTLSH